MVTKVSWTDPTTNADGTPITSGEITGYLVGVRNTVAPGSAVGTYPYAATAPAAATSELFSLLQPLLPTGVVLAVAVQTVSANGNSVWSAEATFTLPSIPNPPSALSVS